jgi:hypothetical protein
MLDPVRTVKEGDVFPRRIPLDLDAGLVVGLFCTVYAAAVGYFRGFSPGLLTGWALLLLACVFGVAGAVVGGVIAGRPDFGPTKRTAAVRGFVAVIPLYATGGLLFLPVGSWFALLPLLSVAAAVLVGPPIGIFVYRTFRRRDAAEAPLEPAVELAWIKGEMAGSWTPLLVSIAILGSLGVGMRVIPDEVTAPADDIPAPPTLTDLFHALPDLLAAVEAEPTDPRARLELGTTLLSLGRFENAMRELTEAVRLDSSAVASWRALGRASYFAGFPQQSARAYWNVLRLDATALNAGGLDRVVLDAALSTEISVDTLPETIN